MKVLHLSIDLAVRRVLIEKGHKATIPRVYFYFTVYSFASELLGHHLHVLYISNYRHGRILPRTIPQSITFPTPF